MASDDRWDDERGPDDDRGRRRGAWADPAAARRRVALPGLLLIIFGVVGVLVEVAGLGAAFVRPTAVADLYRAMIESQPDGPQKEELRKEFQAEEANMRLDTPSGIGGAVAGLLLNLVMVVGGAKMRSLSGYGLSVAGAVCGLIPISGCLCCAMPVGLWALIVLLNGDVKAAFAANRSGRAAGESEGDRWS